MKMLPALGALLLTTVAPPTATAAAHAPACIRIATLISPAAFRRYPAVAAPLGARRQPNVGYGLPRLYRTAVISSSIGPVNFAGRYRVGSHGCGAGMTCPFFINLKTGQVVFNAALVSMAQPFDIADVPGLDDLRLVYRPDSRLLVVIGTRNEDSRLEGVSRFELRGGTLRLLNFIPNSALCLDGLGLEGER